MQREIISDWTWIDRVQANLVGAAPYTAEQLDAAAAMGNFTFIESREEYGASLRLYKHTRHNLYMVAEVGDGFNNGWNWRQPMTDEDIAEFERRNPTPDRPASRLEQLLGAYRNGE